MTFKSCRCKREPDPSDNKTLIKEGLHAHWLLTPSHGDQDAHLTLNSRKGGSEERRHKRRVNTDVLITEGNNSAKCCKIDMKWFINIQSKRVGMEGSAAYNYLRRETRPESISLS